MKQKTMKRKHKKYGLSDNQILKIAKYIIEIYKEAYRWMPIENDKMSNTFGVKSELKHDVNQVELLKRKMTNKNKSDFVFEYQKKFKMYCISVQKVLVLTTSL